MRFSPSITAFVGLLTAASASPTKTQEQLLSIYNDSSCNNFNKTIGVPLYDNNTCLPLPGDGFKLNYYEVGISVRTYFDEDCQFLANDTTSDFGECFDSTWLNSYQIHSIWDSDPVDSKN